MLPHRNSSLALAQQALGQRNYKQACKHAKRAEKEAPNSPVPPNLTGIALSSSGNPNDAIKAFRRALRLNPNFDDARLNLAQTYLLIGQFDYAVMNLKRIQNPNPQVFYLMAQGHAGAGEKAASLQAAAQYIEALPKDKRGYTLRAHIQLQFGLIPDAIADYEAALELDPNDAEVLTLMSLPLARHLRTDEALECAERAAELAPDNLSAQLRLATQYTEVGDKKRAIAQSEQILKAWPGQADALKKLSELLGSDALVNLDADISSALASARKASEEEAALHFAKARVLQAAGQVDEADGHIQRANSFYAKRNPYKASAEEKLARQILKRFPSEQSQSDGYTANPVPIFVVGLPRSGTTLVEAILGVNDKVVPFGERGTLGFLLGETISKDLPFEPEQIDTLRKEDLRLMPAIPEGTQAYVDKMPENYRIVGFLKALYPNSKIIHVCRDPRDIALSMFRAHFAGSALNYTYDLRAMGQRFNLYARMMQHWHTVLPGQIYDLHYEQLVGDVVGEAKQLAAFCEVSWQDQMAFPDQTKSAVLTVSHNQLRQPVHARSVGNWQNHQKLLKPFLQALDFETWKSAIGPTQ